MKPEGILARSRIVDALRLRPGASVRDIARRMGKDETTIAYHLDVLARDGQVRQERVGRVILNYAASSVPTQRERLVLRLSEEGRRIVREVERLDSPASFRELHELLGGRKGRLRYWLTRARRLGLIERTSLGYALTPMTPAGPAAILACKGVAADG